ncbi:MAG: hypothetical protein PHF56_22120 [Desulfuromonadaceae bacterium]|nr:hypothetical protein [Desulfuromonadaceae bacterium]
MNQIRSSFCLVILTVLLLSAMPASAAPPTLVIGAPSTQYTKNGPVSYTVTYTDATSVDLQPSDITLNTTGGATGTVSISGGTSSSPIVSISGIGGNGTIGISIAAGTAFNGLEPAPAASTTSTFLVDNIDPTISISAPTVSSTKTGPVSYTVTYGDANYNTSTLAPANVTLNSTGTATGTVSVTGTSGNTRKVTISSISGEGTLGISIGTGTASDLAGNTAPAAGPSGTFDCDSIAPTVSISAPSIFSTKNGPITYTVTFADTNFLNSDQFTAAKVVLVKTGTANGSVAVSAGSGTSRTVTISSVAGTGTLAISIFSGSARDVIGNVAPASIISAVVIVDNTPPTISVSAPSATNSSAGPVTYTVTYSDTNFTASTLDVGDIMLIPTGTATGTVSVDGGSGAVRTVTIDSITGDGTLKVAIAPGTATDLLGNLAPASATSAAITVDNTAPTITVGLPSLSSTKSGPVYYNITYADANFNASTLSASHVTLTNTGSATGTVSVTGTGASRKVTISSITGEGTLGISIAAGTATDKAGNSAPSAGPSTTFTCDSIVPTISVSPPSVPSTTSGPVTYTVTYADTNFNTSTLTAANVSLVKTGNATGNISVDSGTGAIRTVTVSGISGLGTLAISIAANTATDLTGNKAPASGNSVSFIVDSAAPTITISAPSPTRTATGPITYTATYSDTNFASSSLSLADITLNKTGSANAAVITVGSGTGSVRSVTLSGITGDGTLGISIGAGTAIDLSGNTAFGSIPSPTVAVDNTAPTISISVPSVTETKAGPVSYNITYVDTNFNTSTLSPSQITLIATGSATGTVSVTGTGTTRTVKISAITGFGTLAISIAPGSATDLAGNSAPASGTSAAVNCDSVNPLISVSAPSSTSTSIVPVTYTVLYTDSNFDKSTLTAANVTLVKTGTATGAISVDIGSGTTRTVTVGSISGNGTLAISIAAGTAIDLALNTAPASGVSASFIVDNIAPTIAIGAPSSIRTTAGPITYPVTYADSNFISSSLAVGDITLNKTGTATGTVAVSGTGAARSVTISAISGDGTLGISIDPGTAIDVTGNLAPAAGPSATFSVDNSAPTISIGAPSVNVTKTGPVSFIVSYTDSNLNTSTLTAGDVTLIRTGTANGTVVVAAGTGATRTVTISAISGEGTLRISIGADTASDLFGNKAPASGVSAAISVDSIVPTATISAPSVVGTRTGPVTYTITYADTNFNGSTLTAANIKLNKTGTATGIVTVDSGTGSVRTVTINSISGLGTLGISVSAAGTAADLAGNVAPAAGPSATFAVDSIAPTVIISPPSATIAATGPVTYTVTYNDTSFTNSTLAPANITLNRTGSATGIVSVDSSTGTVRTVTISSISGDGTLGISIAAGTTIDLAGNSAPAAGPGTPFLVDNMRSVAAITVPANNAFVSGGVTTLWGTASDAGSYVQRVELSMDNGASWSTASGTNAWNFNWTLPIDGSYPVLARAVDAAGNVQSPVSAITVNVSNTPPDTFITSGPSDPSILTAGTFTFISSKPGATFECKTDAVAFVACQSPYTTATLGDGRHILTVRAKDAAGTYDPSPAIYSWTVSSSATLAVLSGVPLSPSAAINAVITVAGPGIMSYQFQLDSGAWSVEIPVATPISFTGLTDGLHTLRVRGRDASQNTLQSIPTSVTWAVETTLPTTTIVQAPATLSTTASNIITFRSSKQGTTFRCQLDGGSFAPCASPYVYSALSSGNHTFAVIGADLAGTGEPAPASYSWVIDTVSAIAVLADVPPALTNSTTTAIRVSGAGIVAYKYKLDAGAYGADFAPSVLISLKGLTNGAHVLSVMGKDAVGIYQYSPTSIVWTVDTVKPTTTILTPPPAVSTIATGNIAFSSSKPGSTFTCALDTGAATACSSPFGFLAIGGGAHKVMITATDPAGNIQSKATVANWTVDVTSIAPTIAISAPSVVSTGSGPVSYTITYADANFNGSTLTAADITLNKTGTAAGTVDVDTFSGTVRTVTINSISGLGSLGISIRAGTARDLEGNVAPAAGPSATFIVDGSGPTVVIGAPTASISPPSATVTAFGPVTYTVTYSDTNFKESTLTSADITLSSSGTATGIVSVDSSSGTVRTVTISSISGVGTLGISIAAGTATDLTGNLAGAVGPSAPFVVDNTRSIATITVPATNAFVSGGVTTLRGTASDTGSNVQRVEISTDNGASWNTASGTNAWSYIWTLPLDGSYPVLARAVDAAGNVQTPVSAITVNVSSTPPDTFITSAPSDPSIRTAGTFTFASSKPGVTFECKTDAVVFVSCQSPYTTATFGDGRHTLTVRAKDASGTYDPSPAMYTWRVRSSARMAALSGVPSSPSAIRNALINVTGAGILSYQFQLDSGSWSVEASLTTPIILSGLTDGLHTVRVRGRDSVLNTLQSVPTSVTWTVDTTLSTTTIVQAPASLSTSASSIFIFRSSKQGTTFQCQLDGGGFTACASPYVYSALSSGNHTFAVIGTDLAGTVEPAPASYSWKIDTVSTIAELANVPPALTNSTTTAIRVSGTGIVAYRYQLDAGAYSADVAPSALISLKGLANGAHVLSVIGKDAAGLYQSSPTSIAWTVDTVLPATTIISQPPAVSGTTTGNILFSSSKPGSTFTCELDSGAATACSSPYGFVALGTGTHKVTITATDPAGNTQSKGTVASWTINVTTASVSYSPVGTYNWGTEAVITATFSKAMASDPVPQIMLNGGIILAATDMQRIDATHYEYRHTINSGGGTVYVSLGSGTDTLGNEVEATPVTGATFTVERGNQAITFEPIPSRQMGDPPFALTATVSSGLPIVYSSSRPDVASISGNIVTITGIGTTVITATQADDPLYSPVSASRNFTVSVGTAPPNLSVSTLADGTVTYNPILNVAGTVSNSDSGNSVKDVTVNGQVVTTSTGTFSTVVLLADGANSIATIATDNAANSATDIRTITLDRSGASCVTISAPPDNSVTGQNFVVITGSVADANTTISAKANGGSPATATRSGTDFLVTLNLTAGLNALDITVTTQAGIICGAKRSITSGTTGPTLAVSDPDQDIATTAGSIIISGAVTDAVTNATISITANGQTYEPAVAANGSFSQTIILPTDKIYAIVVTAVDQAGNEATVQRNIIKSTPLAQPTISDALKVFQVVNGIISLTVAEQLRYDVAPLDTGGMPKGNGIIDAADVILIMRRSIGIGSW